MGRILHIWKFNVTMTKKENKFLTWKWQKTMTTIEEYKSINFWHHEKSSTLIVRNYAFPSSTSVLSLSPMTYNTAIFLDKSTCTDYVVFGIRQYWFGQLSWSENDSYILNNEIRVFKIDKNRDFSLVQNLTMEEADINQFMRLRKLLVFAAKNLSRVQILSPLLMST